MYKRQVIYYLSGERFPVGVTMLVFNIPLFILGYRFIGKKFILKTFFGTILLSTIIDTTKPIGIYLVDRFLLNPQAEGYNPCLLYTSIQKRKKFIVQDYEKVLVE